jgi:DNA-binding response OmpR family regulator
MTHEHDIEIVNAAESILLRSRGTTQRIRDRIWTAMQGQPLSGPHGRRPAGVLIVEDESVVRELLELMLRDEGFDVWTAGDGRRALDLLRRHPHEIGVALLDVNMPGLDGPGTLVSLRGLNPQLGCVFMTGQPGEYADDELLRMGAEAVLHKPFTPQELTPILRRLLGDRPGNPADRTG